MSSSRLYLDANATTPPFDSVVAAISHALQSHWGNPSSPYKEGREARRSIGLATECVCNYLGIPKDWLTWTSGGSESINTWVNAIAHQATPTRNKIITTRGEHPAVMQSLEWWQSQGKLEILFADTDILGIVDNAHLKSLLEIHASTTIGAMFIAAHNETGGTQDISAIVNSCQIHSVPVFFDGVQWTGKRPISIESMGITGWSVSFHKFGGPKGVGALIAKPGFLETSLIKGGPQQKRKRAGTENVPGIAGAAAAIEFIQIHEAIIQKTWQAQLEILRAGIPEVWQDATLVHDPIKGLPQTLLVSFPGWRGEELVQRLDLDGIAVSTGSACASGALSASKAMRSMGMSEKDADQLVRISLPPLVPDNAAKQLLAALKNIISP